MQFYRVLIVDDELYIVQCLADLLASQQDLNLDICQAYNGKEALKILEQQRIDILMTDIEMPGLSGLELIRTVKSRWPACKTLIITAHPNFQYAHEAFRLDIVSYILKTEEDERIISEVKKAIRMLEDELDHAGSITESSEDMRIAMHLARRELFLSLLENRYSTTKDGDRILSVLGFHIPMKSLFFVSACILTEHGADGFKNKDSAKAFYTVKMIMSHYITSIQQACFCESWQDRIYWLLEPTPSEDPFLPWLSGMLETVQQSCLATADIHISFIVSPSISTLAQLTQAYRDNEMLLHRMGFQQTDFIYTVNPEAVAASDIADHFDQETVCAQLQILFKAMRYSEFLRLLDEICEPMAIRTDWDDQGALERYFAIALLLVSLIDRRGLRRQLEERVSLHPLFHPYANVSWRAATLYLKKLASELLKSCEEDQKGITSRTIQRIKEYIEQNIAQDITLHQLSEITGYNLSYLSRFFTEKTGENINQYIAKRKLSYISVLMKDNEMSLNEIANKSGFKTRSYFNRFIKHMTGTTPQKLREEESGQEF